MEIQWKDATSYIKRDGNKAPDAWEYNTGSIRIYLTCKHKYHPNKWTIVCPEAGFDPATIKGLASDCPDEAEIKAAQELAIRAVKQNLRKMLLSLPA